MFFFISRALNWFCFFEGVTSLTLILNTLVLSELTLIDYSPHTLPCQHRCWFVPKRTAYLPISIKAPTAIARISNKVCIIIIPPPNIPGKPTNSNQILSISISIFCVTVHDDINMYIQYVVQPSVLKETAICLKHQRILNLRLWISWKDKDRGLEYTEGKRFAEATIHKG